MTQDDLDQEPLVALNPNDELMSNDWSNDADENDVAVFPSSAPEVMVETTSTISKKRKAHGKSTFYRLSRVILTLFPFLH